ncbi:hypothetical protein OM076_22445 [Solirubrobacter ginsenosidimutans]|uniref:Uncharacterized protein n=1 Tax=Solirubrobacter ginsenosidimutans TaxID=490573 RepID=A0A9X3S173_9ACTN|nr:hypothetical protein [Solirubrobacter ginsenosidimutans]MDA0163050.1 hypothetical protein [Solirubrobacter ginsenosidimutans]
MSIRLRLDVEPTSLTLATLDQLKLTLTARNVGMAIVDPELHRARLTVNGTPSKAFANAVGNGRREEKWFALPAGDEVAMTWSTLGERLIFEPGDYALALSLDENAAEPVTVVVAP